MKNKLIAALLAFFMGWIGAHRFYLGQTGKGVLSACFFWTGIPYIIGLIDFVLFLAMDEEEFDHRYNWRMLNRYGERGYQDYDSERRDQKRQYREDKRENAHRRREERRRLERHRREEERQRRHKDQEGFQQKRAASVRPQSNPYKESGIQKYKDFDFEEAIIDFQKALEINAKDVAIYFNLACAYSITEQKDDAFYHLSKAVELGFNNLEKIKTHDALAFLRIQEEFEDFEANNYRFDAPKAQSEKKSPDLLDQLQKLAELRDKGLLTEEEFLVQKKRLLE